MHALMQARANPRWRTALCNFPAMKRTIMHLVVALWVAGSICADQTTQSVQQSLKDQGFYFGNVTGDKSAETTAAIRRYQIRNGLQVTGDVNQETLRSLNLSSNLASSSQPSSKPATTQPSHVRPDESSRLDHSPPPPRVPSEPDRRLETNPLPGWSPYLRRPSRISRRIVVAEVQRQLTSRGYYPGRIDGSYGRGTAFAVRAFQSSTGIPPTGRLDMTTLDALGLSDWNMAYLQSPLYPYANWVPGKNFEHGEWREKWDKHHRDDDGDENVDDDPYGIWERADKEFEYGKREEEREKKWREEWKKQEEWEKKREEWNKKKWEEKGKKHHREAHKHGDKHGKGHDHGHDDD
jgi:peptidoglycan hydrolase-like protein with peptidoglycan-binding domain